MFIMPTSQTAVKGKKIVWISTLVLDVHLHKTSQIEMLEALARRDHKVFLVASNSSAKSPIETGQIQTVSIPLRQIPVFSAGAYALLLFLYLPLFFMRVKPDFVIVEPNPSIFSLFTIVLFPKSRRPKIVLDIRSTPVEVVRVGGYLKKMFFSYSLRVAKRFFQGITIITPMMKTEICDRFSIDPKRVGVWTSGVSTTAFNAESYDKTKIRKMFGLEDKFVVFYHGVLGGKRGIAETIKAVNLLSGRCPDLVLFLLGKTSASLARMIEELSVRKIIITHDSVPYSEVPKYVSLCDVGIVPLPNQPDWRYQCPLNLLEYLSMKKTVIATDIPATRNVLNECKCGIYASSANPEGIAEAIVCAYRNKDMLNEWGACGRSIVEGKYSWTAVAQEFETYLLQL
jgi:glycosyltransferase involved in cell wall biosynthesis